MKEIKDYAKRRFKTKDIREGKVFIGLNFTSDRAKSLIMIDQFHYAKVLLDTYEMCDV